MKVLKGSGLGQGCGHRGEWLWPEGHWPKALEEELTVTGAQGKWEAVGVSVKRKKKKKRNGFFSFLFLRTKKIKRTVSRPEHS